MKASYTTLDGVSNVIEYPVIVPQPMQQRDGFTLLGFEDWEAVTDEKILGAITNVAAFRLSKEQGRMGFHNDKDKN